ncbi:MFS general substrate transporter [Coniophora puteana RWD-64-598 SS2]|uniref:MFS general substrate transporter n=1 Tax=Coniophora puteana (strain RWD-64-598) TaxID=741705 RepID=R7SHI1_CONPW|nr:MFS general substrate transporter [Coniophora puteana RWD-64-598 SS2]EIW74529.1 MFS general substrate transporter [Coniophora puteana RWD-64-598 SS2]
MELQELKRPRVGWFRGLRNRRDEGLDEIATQPSVFDDPVGLEVYRPPPEYENAHRFDPKATWTWREENRLVRKIDIRIMLWSCLMVFCLSLDRGNIQQANTDNFLPDLGLTTDDYNLGNSVFKFAFVSAELPSQIVSKRIGPDVWIPIQITLWSIVSASQFWLTGRPTFLLTSRVLIGFLEGGFIPDTVLYLSYFYTKTELPIRIGWFFVSSQYMSALIGAFVATGFLAIQNATGTQGWRWLFLLEGILTAVVGIASFFMLPPGPTQTKAWFRPKGWFTEREEIIMVNRVLRDDPNKSSMHNRQGLTLPMIWRSVSDWRLWPLYYLGFVFCINVGPPQQYLTLTLRRLGFDTTESNLLTTPSIVIGMIGLVVTTYLAELTNSRTFACLTLQIWAFPLLIALYTFTTETSQWSYYIVVTLITGFPYVHPIQVAWASRNSGSVEGRTVSASLYNICANLGGVAYSNIYKTSDAVRADFNKHGNLALIFITVANIVAYGLTWLFYRETNRRRQAKWDSMSEKEQQVYVETTADKGNQRLDFRFAY